MRIFCLALLVASALSAQSFEHGPVSLYSVMGVGSAPSAPGAGMFGAYGGGVSFRASAWVAPYLEASVAPLTGNFLSLLGISKSQIPAGASVSARSVDFGGGMQIFLARGPLVQPYLLGGAGIERSSISVSERIGSLGGTATASIVSTDPAVHAGFGARFYIGRNLGVRPEVRVYRAFGGTPLTTWRANFGVFYDFNPPER